MLGIIIAVPVFLASLIVTAWLAEEYIFRDDCAIQRLCDKIHDKIVKWREG